MTPLSEPAARGVAQAALFTALVDDAAVFPPGNAPLEVAVREHRGHRSSAYAALVGPLLVPTSGAVHLDELVEVGEDLRVALVARPGTPDDEVGDAVAAARRSPGVHLVGLEVGWSPHWRDTCPADLPLTLEVPRGEAQADALADLATAADAGEGGATRSTATSPDRPVQAKFRTGPTPTWPWPDEAELAAFLRSALDHQVPFKLTGGLHHAVRGTHGGQEQHGLLNVLLAVHHGLAGAEVLDLADTLRQRDAAALVTAVLALGPEESAAVRAAFTAYGCCGVTDPLGELSTLHLLEGVPL